MEINNKEKFDWIDLPCDCCNSASFTELGFRGGRAHRDNRGIRCRIVKCLECGHIYPRPMPVANNMNAAYEKAEDYFVHHDLSNRVKRYIQVLKCLQGGLKSKGRILDVGAGRGEMLYAAKLTGWDAEGIEPSKDFADFAVCEYGVGVKNCTLEEAHYPDGNFDIVTLSGVLEHLCHPSKILSQIYMVLKPGGLLWIDSPNEGSLYYSIGNLYFKMQGKDWVSNLSPTFAPYHVQGFTKNSLRRILSKTGFRLESLKIYSGRALLPKSNVKEYVEYCSTFLIMQIGNLLGKGTYMEAVARKLRSVKNIKDITNAKTP